jgi:hypothetical protein
VEGRAIVRAGRTERKEVFSGSRHCFTKDLELQVAMARMQLQGQRELQEQALLKGNIP